MKASQLKKIKTDERDYRHNDSVLLVFKWRTVFSYSGRLLIYLYIYNLVKLYILVIAAISFRYYDISVPVTKEKTMIQLIGKYTTIWLNIKK